MDLTRGYFTRAALTATGLLAPAMITANDVKSKFVQASNVIIPADDRSQSAATYASRYPSDEANFY